jgi:hypothetical protein
MARSKRERPPDPDRLVRRSAGDLRSEDGRFEVSSTGGAGRWYVTDAERHDGLGLALVLGPFATLDQVRAAIVAQRATPAGDDGPLPQPVASEPAARPRASRPTAARAAAKRPPEPPEPEPRAPDPEPESPAPPPAPPPVRVEHARWRARGDDRDAAVAVVRRINDAWLAGDPDAMADDLHASVVLLPPDDGTRVEGRDAAIGSYRAFLATAVVRGWTDLGLTCDAVDATAVVRYRFELRWTTDGGERTDVGHDLWVLARQGGRWRAVWRTTTPIRDA